MEEQKNLPLGRRLLQMNLSQWIVLVSFIASVIGYIFHEEQQHENSIIKQHDQEQKLDSIILKVNDYHNEAIEFRAKYYEKIRADHLQEEKEDERMDRMETQETINKTEFDDFLYWNKFKNK